MTTAPIFKSVPSDNRGVNKAASEAAITAEMKIQNPALTIQSLKFNTELQLKLSALPVPLLE
jgi:hypothetical protein